MKTMLTRVKTRVGPSQGKALQVLGGPLGGGHKGHMSTSEDLSTSYVTMEALALSASKPFAKWFWVWASKPGEDHEAAQGVLKELESR